ncbi:nucleoside monophosphate kinase [Leptolyngbya sp. PCC 6406]|uniref:nucleoside monophosphate kinase n=1 Tax=Leptolyngbya sp. PCC 6406 TaxID=1173264 RepID=UPI0002ABB8E1|nr:nucleoside monophosphate kinase [Leptolyngbya sp. PCC 6406]
MKTKQFILLGPPGVGVKAQANALAKRWHIPHISVGDLCREAIEKETAIGIECRPYLETGNLVPDEWVMKLIRKRFEQPDTILKGWVLDGFPRTLTQAQAFDEWCLAMGQSAVTVVYLKAMTGLLINRLSTEKGQAESLSSIRNRLALHEEETAPLLAYYREQSKLATVNASLSFAEVAHELAQMGQENTGAAKLINDEAELDALLAHESRLVVDCMASWCGSCKQVTPMIDRLAETYGNQVTVMKIDFDTNRQITKRFELKGIPAVMFFKDGERIETLTGVKSYQEYSAAATRLLAR